VAPEEIPEAAIQPEEAVLEAPATAAPEAPGTVTPTPEAVEMMAAPAPAPPAFEELANTPPSETPRSEIETPPDAFEPPDLHVAAVDPSVYAGFDTLDDADHTEPGDFARFDPMAFDDGADGFVVESLEPEPISFASFDASPADRMVEAIDAPLGTESVGAREGDFASGEVQEVIESVDNYLLDEPTLANDEPWAESAEHPVELAAAGEAAPVAETSAMPLEELAEERAQLDPWEGAELPEPAFGSIGWPSDDIAGPAVDARVDTVDEMSEALAWSEADVAEGVDDQASYASDANDAEASGEDAFSGMANELRDSSSAWAADAGTIDDDADVSARARFFGGGDGGALSAPESIDSYDGDVYEAEPESAEPLPPEESVIDGEQGDQGAAIADALGRVAARIRSGEVELPSEVMGASDESALAAALAALLRGPRR
jgi:hypothetical protein